MSHASIDKPGLQSHGIATLPALEHDPMTRAAANLLLVVTGAIWGMGFVTQATAMDDIGPVFFTGIRFFAAALAVLPFAIWESRTASKPIESGSFLKFAALGTFLFASLVTQQIGLLTTTVTNSGFLTGTYVVFVPILGVLVFRQWPHRVIWPAVALVTAGIFLLSGGKLDGLTRGDIWTLVCAMLWACHVLLLGRISPTNTRPFLLATAQFFTCGLLGTGLGLSIEDVTKTMIENALPEILFAGVISGGVAFTLQVIAQRYTTSAQAAIFMSSESLFAALFGALFLGERLAMLGIVGCMMIFAAMLAVELVPMREAKRAKTRSLPA